MFDIGTLQPAYRDKYYASADDIARLNVICTFLNEHYLPDDELQILHKEILAFLEGDAKSDPNIIHSVVIAYLNQHLYTEVYQLVSDTLSKISQENDDLLDLWITKAYLLALANNDHADLEHTIKKVKKIKDKSVYCDQMLKLSDIYNKLSLPDKAVTLLSDAINTLPKAAKEESIRLQTALTKIFIDINRLTGAEQTLDAILEIKKEVNDPLIFIQLLLLQSQILFLQKEYTSSSEMINEAIEVSVTSGVNAMLSGVFLEKGKICLAKKDYAHAGEALEKSLAHLASEVKNTATAAELYELLSTVHTLKKNYKLALEYHKAFYEKQQAIQLAQVRSLAQKSKLQKLLSPKISAPVVSEPVVAYEKQELKPAEKKQDLRESVFYLKHIQKELLPGLDTIYNLFPDSFIIYKPKTNVSNHFYWFARSNNDQDKVYVAVAQSVTGDTAGAYMSMIATNKLNKALFDEKFNLPGVMLSYLNTRIKTTFKQSSAEQLAKIGFEMSICAFDLDSKRMIYSGAGLGLLKYTIDNFIEFLPTKAIVGGNTSAQQSYNDEKRELTTGDTFYLMTKGVFELMGGDKEKRLGEKKLKEVLQSIQNISMIEQERYLNEFLNRWIGDSTQSDDILIIGIRT